MSQRNYKPEDGPLGKFRDPGDTPPEFPEVDVDSALKLFDWRNKEEAGPFLDELIGYYRLYPPTSEIAEKYIGEPRKRAVGQEAVKEMLANKDDVIAAGQRQLIHIAENTEENIAMFWAIASMRQQVLAHSLKYVILGEPIPDDYAVWATDSILDLGICLREPFTGKDWHKKFPRPPIVIPSAIKRIAPNIGSQVTEFGKYSSKRHETLISYEGVSLMELALEEQEQRMNVWYDCHEAIVQASPTISQSEDILLERVPLGELLEMQKTVIGR